MPVKWFWSRTTKVTFKEEPKATKIDKQRIKADFILQTITNRSDSRL